MTADSSFPQQAARQRPGPSSVRPTAAVVGAGAAGSAVAVQLCETAARRGSPLDLVLIDPAPEAGRGTAYATQDPRHLLNVPAGNMSCYPDDPGHFVRWLCRHGEPGVTAADFVPRHQYGSYLADVLGRAIIAAHGTVRVRRLRTRAVGLTRRGTTTVVALADGTELSADAVVLATGPQPQGTGWVPDGLRGSERLVADPWAPGALDEILADPCRGDVLLVGTGLTAVDVALAADRQDRTVHAVSPSGRLPEAHTVAPPPAVAPGPLRGLSLDGLRTAVLRHVSRAVRAHGDWRPGLDGLRPVTAALWASLSPDERAEFSRRDGSLWNRHRHRMPPVTAEAVGRMRRMRRMRLHAGRVTAVQPGANGSLRVRLSPADAAVPYDLSVAWVVNCTGPAPHAGTADPLWQSLFHGGTAVCEPLGMGVATDDGRLVGAGGRAALPLWTLGAPRRGELWESTAMPEIRAQATAVAEAVLTHLAPDPAPAAPVRRLPSDLSGHPLHTHAAAASAYRAGVARLLKVRTGAEPALRRAVALDPGFGLAHAVLALVGHEFGAGTDVCRSLADAQRSVRERGGDMERSFVEVVSRRVQGTPEEGDAALLRHLDRYPGDALALAVAVPTIAFSGLRDLDSDGAARIVGRTATAQDGSWFHTSLLAFVRQEQGRYDEAGQLAERALTAEPASGHAMHALAHVHYECGRHTAGVNRIDHWLGGHGRGATHRAHFSWHAALHELALGDTDAVRARFLAQLSPAKVGGTRALVDSCSLLWRARVTGNWYGRIPVDEVLHTVPADALERPVTPFIALHAAVAHLAVGDVPALYRLRDHARATDPVQREVVAPLCEAFTHLVTEDWDAAVSGIRQILPVLRKVGGSDAQRDIVAETLLYALVSAGRCEEAGQLLTRRQDRRTAAARLLTAGEPARQAGASTGRIASTP
ncbi:FAD/NAD(P)-binding protein [Streptomyces canus]|uniref:FAD/NAD(P)-binding protein n=1 Tax=Streptomyces canus TaxID=58343 RepID=UPI00324F909A